MILSNVITIKVSNNQIKHYRDLGYQTNGGNIELNVKVKDLPKNSGQKILVKCDFCGTEKYISMNRYSINTDNSTLPYACSRKCAEKKNKEKILNKYGVDNISKLDTIKEKKKETCLKNNNVKYPQQSDEIKNKGKKTKLEKYGDENYTNEKKRKETCLDKYGVEHPMKCKDVVDELSISLNQTLKNKILNNQKYLNLNIKDYSDNLYTFECDCGKNHNFQISYKLLWQRTLSKTILCTNCNPIDRRNSGLELELQEFIMENYDGKIITNCKDIIKPYELDIYLPELKMAFEFNGLYWHNELNKDKRYHQNKTNDCLKQGLQLIHVWEDDWIYKKDIVKSIILNKMGKTSNKIFARKCILKEVDNKLSKKFLIENHIQGNIGSKIKIGLFFNDELVSLMAFGNKRVAMGQKKNDIGYYELLRFCNKLNTNVIGGASKIFSYFIKTYKPLEIISYADKSFSNGNLYYNLGFEKENDGIPNYYYIIDGKRYHRFNFRKDKLIKQGFDPLKSEHQIMLERNIYRIFDSGHLKFKWNSI